MTKKKIAEAKKVVKAILKKVGRKRGLLLVDVLAIFRRYNPSTFEEAKAIGFKLKYLGEGCFREGYAIEVFPRPLVVKFPKYKELDNIYHSNEEFTIVSSLRKKKEYKVLHRYLPDILYHNKKTGVIVMPLYEKYEYGTDVSNTVETVLANLVTDLGFNDHDVHCNNIGHLDDEPKIFDVGILGTW